jgi:hypothetical protein
MHAHARAHARARHCSPRCGRCSPPLAPAPAPHPQFAFIMRVSEPAALEGEAFAEIELRAGDNVARLAGRACEKFPRWGVDAGQVRLLLVPAAAQQPTLAELEAALLGVPLSPFSALADVGVVSGCCLLARVPPRAAAPGAFLSCAPLGRFGTTAPPPTPPLPPPHTPPALQRPSRLPSLRLRLTAPPRPPRWPFPALLGPRPRAVTRRASCWTPLWP